MAIDWRENLNKARKFYSRNIDEIMRAPAHVWSIDPYAWEYEGDIKLSHIEAALWYDIRLAGAVLYPQFPVGRYVVDFANPVARCAIECDGKAYHQDKAKDAKRTQDLTDMGWCIYRLTGAECVSVDKYDEDGATIQRSPASELIRRVSMGHGLVTPWKINAMSRNAYSKR